MIVELRGHKDNALLNIYNMPPAVPPTQLAGSTVGIIQISNYYKEL